MKKKQIFSWCLYDFANSSFSAVIAAVVFPVFFVKVISPDAGTGDLWWGRAISLSMLVVALSSPIVGGISDYSGRRKRFLASYTVLCVVSVGLLGFVEKGMVMPAFLLVVLANIGMEGALVFYNSYLPDISTREYHGRISGWGFGLGYAGSVISLLLSMYLMKKGLIQWSWPMVSLFYLLFAFPAFFHLPQDRPSGPLKQGAGEGIKKTMYLLKEILKIKEVRRFLIAYWLYKDAVNTIIVFSSIYAAVTLSFSETELVVLYLLVQITAMAGAFAFSVPTDKWGARKVIMLSLLIWVCVTVGAYVVETKVYFWYICIVAGLVLGSVQAASRALYAAFIPHGREGEYFGIYALAGKTSAVLGPALFGMISSFTGSQRPAVLSVVALLVLGMWALSTVKVELNRTE